MYLKDETPTDIGLEQILSVPWPFSGPRLLGLAVLLFRSQIAFGLPSMLHWRD